MGFVTGIVTGLYQFAVWLLNIGWNWLVGLVTTLQSLVNTYIIPTLKWLVGVVAKLSNSLYEFIKTVKGWIDQAVGGLYQALDATEARLLDIIGAKTSAILKELGIREGLLKKWVVQWVQSQFKPVWDQFNVLRSETFKLYQEAQHSIDIATKTLKEWTSTQVEILGHKIEINTENLDQVLKDLGITEEEEYITPEQELILGKLKRWEAVNYEIRIWENTRSSRRKATAYENSSWRGIAYA